MAYLYRVKAHFDAAHHLPGYNGPCANVHGHRWEVEVFLPCDMALKNEVGMVIDFKAVKTAINDALPDHQDLNIGLEHPTAENLIDDIAREICRRFWALNLPMPTKIILWESPEAGIEITPASIDEIAHDYQEGFVG